VHVYSAFGIPHIYNVDFNKNLSKSGRTVKLLQFDKMCNENTGSSKKMDGI